MTASEIPAPSPTPDTRDVQEVNVCELETNAGAYQKKLVRVTGFANFEFEDFSFSDPTCDSKDSIWLDYGGKTAAGAMYCCGVTSQRTREKSLVVAGIAISLTEDKVFQTFDNLIHRPPRSTIRATLIGRFFSGEKDPKSGTWAGYGHFGCCSLLVIEQVVNVDKPDSELDSQSFANEDKYLEKFSTMQYIHDIPTGKAVIAEQKEAEEGHTSWRFFDHRRLVAEYLSHLLSTNDNSTSNLKIAQQSPGRIIYLLKTRTTHYVITISRPNWLSYYSKDPKKVIWTIDSVVQGL